MYPDEAPQQGTPYRGEVAQAAKPMTLMDLAERNSKLLDELKMTVSGLADKLEPVRDRLPVESESAEKREPDTTKLGGRLEVMRQQIRQITSYVEMITREVNL